MWKYIKLAVVVLVLIPGTAAAERLVVTFNGILDSRTEAFTGSLVFNRVDGDPPGSGYYMGRDGVSFRLLTSGGRLYEAGGWIGQMGVIDNGYDNGKHTDAVLLRTELRRDFQNGPLFLHGAELHLSDSLTREVLTSRELTSMVLRPSQFRTNELRFYGSEEPYHFPGWSNSGRLLSVTLTREGEQAVPRQETPEPASLTMLAVGTAGLAAYRYRRRR